MGKGLKKWNLRNWCQQSNDSWGENGDNEDRHVMRRLNGKGKSKHNKKKLGFWWGGKKERNQVSPAPSILRLTAFTEGVPNDSLLLSTPNFIPVGEMHRHRQHLSI